MIRKSAIACPRALLCLLTLTFAVLSLSGCSGGWGDLKPTIATLLPGQSKTVTAGQPVTFTVVVESGTGPFTYQWYRAGVAIPGANSSSYTIAVTKSSDNGAVFTVTVANAGGSAVSAPYHLTVNTPPSITTQPRSQSVIALQPVTFSVVATGTAPLSYQWYQNGTAISGATQASYTLAVTAIGDSGNRYTATATNMAGKATSAAASLTVLPAAPVLSFAPIASQTYGNAPFAVSASSASSGAVTYSVVSGSATIAGNEVTLTGVGTVVLQASQAASGSYTAATATASFSVAPEVPVLRFAAIAPQAYGSAAFPVSATSVSNGAVTYSVESGPATIAGNLVTATGIGTIVLNASQAASGNYAAAIATTTVAVGPEVPVLSFAPIAPQTFGGPAFAVSATSISNGAVTYSVVSGPATIAGNLVTATGAGSVVLKASQAASGNFAAATATTSVSIGLEVPTLTFAPIAPQKYGNASFPVSATSASNGAVTYSVVSGPATISGNVVTLTGVGTVILKATQAASGNYAAATATTSFAAGAGTPTLTFAPIAPQTYGNPAFPVSATSVSNGAVTYSVASGPATISGNVVTITGIGTVVLDASQAATADYAAATASTSFAVTAEVPTLTFQSIPFQTYGDSPFVVSASSASSGAITYAVVSGPATISGDVVTVTGAGTVVLSASQAANGNYAAATATTTVTVNVQMSPIQPADTTIGPGTQTFTDTVTGGQTDGITWTASDGSITAGGVWTSPKAAGHYTITATSVDDPTISVSTNVYVSAPVITAQPVSQNLCTSGSLTLSVTANYADSYQWYLGSSPIAGATGPTYSVASAAANQAGNYTVVVTNPAGTITSGEATVEVGSTVTNPASLTINQYQTASFSVSASGKSPFTYQWYMVPSGSTSGSAVSGATSSAYITPAETTATPANEPIGYYAMVTDACGTALTTTTAELTVGTANTPPTITTQPLGQTTPAGNTATFTVAAVGSGSLAYQWYRIPAGSAQGTTDLIPGANSPSYTVPITATNAENDQDIYYVVVTNAYGQAVSQHATLAVGAGIQIQILDQPVNAYVNAGDPASFTIKATSTLPLSYQWYRVPPGQSASANTFTIYDGSSTISESTPASAVPIDGATSATYTIPTTSADDTGSVYYVVVSNGSTASVTSSSASLFVGAPAGIAGCAADWNTIGNAMTVSGTGCPYQLTAASGNQHGEIVWPTLISTGNIQLSFTIATSDPSSPPADGFAMVLGDPSLGATPTSLGNTGEGLGARGIPGFVLAFDDYYNPASGGTPPYPQDPAVPYLGVGRGESALWENPYFYVNTNIPALAASGQTVSHNYVVSIVKGYMTVTMDGTQVFSGSVSVPPVAYLYFTSSTGGSWEQTVISNISANVSAPSN